MKNWSNFDDKTKQSLIKTEHIDGSMSIRRMAEKYGTYPNKIARDAKRLGMNIDNKSAAQKKVLKFGLSKHPTEGKERSLDEKRLIAKNRREAWDNLSETEKASESKRLKKMYQDQEVKMHESPMKIVKLREAAQSGSKLEVYVFERLKEEFGGVIHQMEDVFSGQSFHIDIFISPNIAIEIDGPSHYKAIWGKEKLKVSKDKDFRKSAACLSKGYYFISVINDRAFSISYGDKITTELVTIINKIQKGLSKEKKIICEVENE